MSEQDEAAIAKLQKLINEALVICDDHGFLDLAVHLSAAHDALIPHFERAGMNDAIVRIQPPLLP